MDNSSHRHFVGLIRCQHDGEWGYKGQTAIVCVEAATHSHACIAILKHAPSDWEVVGDVKEVPYYGVFHPLLGTTGL